MVKRPSVKLDMQLFVDHLDPARSDWSVERMSGAAKRFTLIAVSDSGVARCASSPAPMTSRTSARLLTHISRQGQRPRPSAGQAPQSGFRKPL